MTIRVALHHRTTYQYDRSVTVHPQLVRLRPAPHCRTPIQSYSLKVQPADHFENWQQDPHGNFLARCVFPKPVKRFEVVVDLVADMTVINPFDFFIEESAETYPFEYEEWLKRELRPYLDVTAKSKQFEDYFRELEALRSGEQQRTAPFIVALNQKLEEDIDYQIRMEPGVQSPEETLSLRKGSCRDSSWLLVQLLRRFGLAARFVSGYLIQLAPDEKPLDGPVGPESDFTDLHAWTEVFLPGAGWVGLDPTSGLLAGEGHIPLAATPEPSSAAPISGNVEECEVEFDFDMHVTRVHEDPRVTKPYTEREWAAIEESGQAVDERLNRLGVQLTMGGEPTFVSIDDMDGEEWNSAAVGHEKRRLSEELIHRLRDRFAGGGGLLHFGQGKWYPGESLPRWSLACYWRKDGFPIWNDASLIADTSESGPFTHRDAKRFLGRLVSLLEVPRDFIVPAFEDVAYFMVKEQRLPINVTPDDPKLADAEERSRMTRVFERGINEPCGFVLPLRCQWWQAKARGRRSKWLSGPWSVRADKLFLLPGDSPLGLRLPLDALPYSASGDLNPIIPVDPLSPRGELPKPQLAQQAVDRKSTESKPDISPQELERAPESGEETDVPPGEVLRTALCVEERNGHLHVFMPPVERIEDYLELAASVEEAAALEELKVVVEGYHPPDDSRVSVLKVTPDPGVIEVNTQPTSSWDELVELTRELYEEARQTRLGTEKFDLDGKHTGTGGGNHVVVGAADVAQSPFLRRPDLLKSLLGYWVNHPSLSYLFSGRFIGPTSQAPRVDEGRRDALYELQLAFDLVPRPSDPDRSGADCPPWLVDRIFRNLLVDLTGNTHRAEFCIDKLFSPDSSSGRLGLVEFRGFEMPPHADMSLTQQLLIRAMIAAFWERPYEEPLVAWGTSLHDRFMLPHFVWEDFRYVIDDLERRGFPLQLSWYRPHFEFRFQKIGECKFDNVDIELRSAIEPWYVMGEEGSTGGTVRFVDSSVERMQVIVDGLVDPRHVLTCNGRRLPLKPTGNEGQFVCGIRYRAWQPPSCLHPTIPVHTPLTIDIIDTHAERSVGGCCYHVSHPAGRNYESFPVNASEAEARRSARFFAMGHTPGDREVPFREVNPSFPYTLDLRRRPQAE